ncbi:MAG: histidine phosphatase family protein [Blastocatellales bacterium]
MSTLTLIRHGQARAFDRESDRLTETGEAQARVLGEYWLNLGERFDEVYAGTLTRQIRTAEIAGESFARAGVAWPGIETRPEFNEYDADGLLNRLAPELARRDSRFRALIDDFEANRQAPDRNRYFQHMFEFLTGVWQSGSLEIDGVESWSAFRERVSSAIIGIIGAEKGGRNVAVFTSGGVIGMTVQKVLDAPEMKALEINWRVRNCSLTGFIFGRGRISLDSFNRTDHLEPGGLITYR